MEYHVCTGMEGVIDLGARLSNYDAEVELTKENIDAGPVVKLPTTQRRYYNQRTLPKARALGSNSRS